MLEGRNQKSDAREVEAAGRSAILAVRRAEDRSSPEDPSSPEDRGPEG